MSASKARASKAEVSGKPQRSVTAFVLAGGLSTRMGREKSRLRIGKRSMIGHARHLAGQLGLRVRVIRRDLVPRCGPLGGLLTALSSTNTEANLFLACDMPFLGPDLVNRVLSRLRRGGRAVFTEVNGVAGFPFALRTDCLPFVELQIERKELSLQAFAKSIRAARIPLTRSQQNQILNVNSPTDFQLARSRT